MATDDRTVEIEQLLRRGELEPQTHTFARLADLYRQQGRHERALGAIREGLKDHPYYLDARLLHARVLLELGSEDAARDEFEHILTLDPANPLACMALGVERAETNAGDRGRAVSTDDWLDRLEEAWCSEEADTHPASDEGGIRVASVRPRGIETETLARLYAEQGLFDRAIRIYEHMLTQDPDNADLLDTLAELRRRAEGGDALSATGPRTDRAEVADRAEAEGADRAEAAERGEAGSIREQLLRILDGGAPTGSN